MNSFAPITSPNAAKTDEPHLLEQIDPVKLAQLNLVGQGFWRHTVAPMLAADPKIAVLLQLLLLDLTCNARHLQRAAQDLRQGVQKQGVERVEVVAHDLRALTDQMLEILAEFERKRIS